jgi:hypothetical protein
MTTKEKSRILATKYKIPMGHDLHYFANTNTAECIRCRAKLSGNVDEPCPEFDFATDPGLALQLLDKLTDDPGLRFVSVHYDVRRKYWCLERSSTFEPTDIQIVDVPIPEAILEATWSIWECDNEGGSDEGLDYGAE